MTELEKLGLDLPKVSRKRPATADNKEDSTTLRNKPTNATRKPEGEDDDANLDGGTFTEELGDEEIEKAVDSDVEIQSASSNEDEEADGDAIEETPGEEEEKVKIVASRVESEASGSPGKPGRKVDAPLIPVHGEGGGGGSRKVGSARALQARIPGKDFRHAGSHITTTTTIMIVKYSQVVMMFHATRYAAFRLFDESEVFGPQEIPEMPPSLFEEIMAAQDSHVALHKTSRVMWKSASGSKVR